MIKAVIFDMDGLILDTEKLLVKYWCQAANEAGFPMQREHALNIRSLARKFAIPYLQGIFGEEFDYVKIRSRRMELMKQHISEHGLETKPGIAELLDYLDSKGIPAAAGGTAGEIQQDSLCGDGGKRQAQAGYLPLRGGAARASDRRVHGAGGFPERRPERFRRGLRDRDGPRPHPA